MMRGQLRFKQFLIYLRQFGLCRTLLAVHRFLHSALTSVVFVPLVGVASLANAQHQMDPVPPGDSPEACAIWRKLGLGDPVLTPTDRMYQMQTVVGRGEDENLAMGVYPEEMIPVRSMYMSPALRSYNQRNRITHWLRLDAGVALERMLRAASSDGVQMFVHSAYRSWRFQCRVFSSKVDSELQSGRASSFFQAVQQVNTRSAFPGQSEHQLGTVVDLVTSLPRNGFVLDYAMASSPAYDWLTRFAHHYGFVLSFPRSSETGSDPRAPNPETGYIFEPWHWRYIGEELAKDFQGCGDSNLQRYLTQVTSDPAWRCGAR